MRLSISYDKAVIQEMIETDRLLQFRLNLLLNKEMKNQDEAYISIFQNEISNDVFRLKRYMDLLQNKN